MLDGTVGSYCKNIQKIACVRHPFRASIQNGCNENAKNEQNKSQEGTPTLPPSTGARKGIDWLFQFHWHYQIPCVAVKPFHPSSVFLSRCQS
jgi:hypothetical protein